MKKLSLVLFVVLGLSFVSLAQQPYEIQIDPQAKVLKGLLTRQLIESDTSFSWFAANQKFYTPEADIVETVRTKSTDIHFVVYMGTWCEDSYFVIPRFFKLLDVSEVKEESKVTLIGVDRNKKTLAYLAEALDVKNVPTIIVMKGGKELGRVVEYGKSGSFDKDLAAILKQE